MSDKHCPKCGSWDSFGSWIRIRDKSHRQFKRCHGCGHKVYREQPRRLRDRIKRDWRKGE